MWKIWWWLARAGREKLAWAKKWVPFLDPNSGPNRCRTTVVLHRFGPESGSKNGTHFGSRVMALAILYVIAIFWSRLELDRNDRPRPAMSRHGRPWLTSPRLGRSQPAVADHGRPQLATAGHGWPLLIMADHGWPRPAMAGEAQPWVATADQSGRPNSEMPGCGRPWSAMLAVSGLG